MDSKGGSQGQKLERRQWAGTNNGKEKVVKSPETASQGLGRESPPAFKMVGRLRQKGGAGHHVEESKGTSYNEGEIPPKNA